jgi:RHS repeat-associated protein
LDGRALTTSYTYDAVGNKLTETDPLGHTTAYTYNALKQPLTIKDALGHTSTNTYDPQGNLLTTTDPNGKTTTYTYYPSGQPKTVVDALNHTTSFVYDAKGNLTSQTDALNSTTSYTYDGNGNKLSQSVTRTVSGSTQMLTTTYDYDGNNRVTKTHLPDGTYTEVQYNSIGKQSVTWDAKRNQTQYAYDDQGHLKTTLYADGSSETTGYDNNGNRTSFTDRGGRTTKFEYDGDNRLTITTYPDNSVSITNYDTAGRVSSVQDRNGNLTHYSYDDAGRRTSVTDALNHTTSFAYDDAGQQTAMTDARQNTIQYAYDNAGRQTKVIYPDTTFAQTGYDDLGRMTSKTDQAGIVTQYGYDNLGRLTSVTQDAGGLGHLNLVTSYGYDELGERISQTDANNHTTTFAYDQNGRRIGRTLPLGQSESYSYESNGNLHTHTDFNGRTTTYAYDPLNRLLSKTADPYFVTNHLGAAQVSFTYTASGKRQTMADASGTTTYNYDPTTDRLMSKQTPFGTVTYTYDNAGDVLSISSSNQNGAAMAYGYDQLNRLASVTVPGQAPTQYTYDEVGNLGGYTLPNGVVVSYSYDELSRLHEMASNANGNAVSRYTYTLGAAGNRTAVSELNGKTVQWGYDNLYRLTSEQIANDPAGKNGSVGYTYDPVGNRQSISSTLAAIPPTGMLYYDANDRTSTDTYDNDGNTVWQAGIQNQYDFENHLVQHGDVKLVYDGDGNRVAETIGGVTTSYLVDDVNPTGYVQTLDELQAGSVARSYTWGHWLLSEAQPLNGGWSNSFYGYDGHGSVRQLFDASGTITDAYDYDAFGNLINSTGSTPNVYLYSGEAYDSTLGLYYNRARYLDVRTGRFWGVDTYEGSGGDPVSLHKYVYSNNDPVNRRDPSGYDSIVDLPITLSISVSEDAITVISEKGVEIVASAPVASSAVQTALQWILTAAVVAPLVIQTGNDRPIRHSGRLQVQGGDIKGQSYNLVTHPDFNYAGDTLSWPWSQSSPLPDYNALSKLSEFLQILTRTQIGRRGAAFAKASRFIVNASIGGGIWAPVSVPFNAQDPDVPDARVDIEVQSGQAFVPGP